MIDYATSVFKGSFCVRLVKAGGRRVVFGSHLFSQLNMAF